MSSMPVPLPDLAETLLTPPDPVEAEYLARGIVSAVSPSTGLTPLQSVLLEAVFEALTGHHADMTQPPLDPRSFAEGLARRNEAFRTRILQVMILGALVLRPLPEDVADRLTAFAAELSVADGMLEVAREYARGHLGLAAVDFERNGYTADWSHAHREALHTSSELQEAWELAVNDAALAARWQALESLPEGTLGRRITEFYRARGFAYPGRSGSAPPLLAQHDWVHIVADYGTKVESELEVFAFIARANDDPKAFSLLAMVISLFETGYMRTGAGLFEASPGQLSHDGVAVRVADAMRRGALVKGSVDFMATDWFELATSPVSEVRERFGVTGKSDGAVRAGSVGPWEPGGISEFQRHSGEALAEREGRPYDGYGASIG
jgi:hypothetical protein